MSIEFSQFQVVLQQQLQQSSGLCEKGRSAALNMSAKLDAVLIMSASVQEADLSVKKLAKELIKQAVLETHSVRDYPCTRLLLANYVLQLADQLNWYQRCDENNPAFNKGHANAQIIGPAGIFYDSQVMVGVTVMQPKLRYPDHNHPPEEVYVILSEGMWWQEGGNWYSPGVQSSVYNPAGISHAMQAVGQPLFALWCLNL
ncbi:MAG: quercetin dioxygenase-like cupin family protein [Oceanospirillaceae bacterium]|jgi:quercetin dioxygenase-like cupin family protein